LIVCFYSVSVVGSILLIDKVSGANIASQNFLFSA